MKRKFILSLIIVSSLYITACGKQEPVSTVEPTETIEATIEATTEQSETETETEKTTETSMEEVNNKIFGLDDTVVSDDNASTSETTTTRTDYPDSNPEHQKAWDNFCNNWNESDYGTTTKGKTQNDFP